MQLLHTSNLIGSPSTAVLFHVAVMQSIRSCEKSGSGYETKTSTTSAETQSSDSSIGVQSKESFIVFLVIKMSCFQLVFGKR